MYSTERVLVGVINRKKDFVIAKEYHWYRIPQARLPDGVDAEYIAFFLSGKPFNAFAGTIPYFARITGYELAYRRELLPDEDQRADDIYYKLQFKQLIEKNPPIVNATKRRIAFIRTTWDRFVDAETIADLYTDSDYYVDRIYYALNDRKGL